MTVQLGHSEIITLDVCAVAQIRTVAHDLADEPGASSAQLAERGAALTSAFPPKLARALHRYGNVGSVHNTLLVRNLLPTEMDPQPTPATTTPGTLDRDAQASALTLLAVLSPSWASRLRSPRSTRGGWSST